MYNVGFNSKGRFQIKEKNDQGIRVKTRAYDIWFQMLKRCYSESSLIKNPTYVGCTVCDEWLDFQNFAEWYTENYYSVPGERMDLDKDLLVRGNRVYSPKTCIIVPQAINLLIMNRDKSSASGLPLGVTFHKGGYRATLTHTTETSKVQIYGGKYKTPEEASAAYMVMKRKYALETLNRYEKAIPVEVFLQLYNVISNI